MADTKKPSLKVREFRLFELERIAAAALAKGPQCVRGRRVNIGRLVQETFGLKIIAFRKLSRRWKTYAFIDTTGKAVFVDADLIDNVQLKKNTASPSAKNWPTSSFTRRFSPTAKPLTNGWLSRSN